VTKKRLLTTRAEGKEVEELDMVGAEVDEGSCAVDEANGLLFFGEDAVVETVTGFRFCVSAVIKWMESRYRCPSMSALGLANLL
jgi:hypothetical protein